MFMGNNGEPERSFVYKPVPEQDDGAAATTSWSRQIPLTFGFKPHSRFLLWMSEFVSTLRRHCDNFMISQQSIAFTKNKLIAVSEARSTDRVSSRGALIRLDDFDWQVRYLKIENSR